MEKNAVRSHLLKMVRRYQAGKANENERKFIDRYYDSFDRLYKSKEDADLYEGVKMEFRMEEYLTEYISGKVSGGRTKRLIRLFRPGYIAAASVILCLASGLFWHYRDISRADKYVIIKNDIAPGQNKAVLTLADGSRIALNNAANGQLATQAGVTITKTAGGQVIYRVTDLPADGIAAVKTLSMNTITTPRGGQWQLILPDGTHVWLNALSSITYPVVFAQGERKVEVKGEVYFEVAKKFKPGKGTRLSERMPFIVRSAGQRIEVLGTHFNTNSYGDEGAVKTTLIEGSVKISQENSDNQVIIKPGQQAVLRNKRLSVRETDTELAVSWKDGYFHFKRAGIHEVMRQLARWYDVDIAYEGNLPERAFSGDIDRNSPISVALEMLATLKVHFRAEGEKIIVTP